MEVKRFWCSGDLCEIERIGKQPNDVVMATEFDRVTAERDALQQRLNAVEEENDRLRAVEAAAKEMLRIAGIAKQGSNAYNRAIIHLHQALENRS